MKKTNKEIDNQCIEDYDMVKEKQKLLEALKQTKSIQDRVDIFGKIMDTYGVDVIVGLIPGLGDAGSSIVSTLFFLYQGQKVGLSTGDSLKIIGYQTADVIVGTIPILGDIADYFFKANKRSANIFKKHFKKIEQEAMKKGIDQKKIENIKQQKDRFIEILSEKKK